MIKQTTIEKTIDSAEKFAMVGSLICDRIKEDIDKSHEDIIETIEALRCEVEEITPSDKKPFWTLNKAIILVAIGAVIELGMLIFIVVNI